MTQWWAVIDAGGSQRYIATAGPLDHPRDAGHGDDCASAVAVLPIARRPNFDERIDPDTGAIVYDADAAALAEARRIIAYRPSPALAEVHALKEAEARDVLAGGAGGVFLAAEATATGMTVEALAALVVKRADEDRAAFHQAMALIEADRRKRKKEKRDGEK